MYPQKRYLNRQSVDPTLAGPARYQRRTVQQIFVLVLVATPKHIVGHLSSVAAGRRIPIAQSSYERRLYTEWRGEGRGSPLITKKFDSATTDTSTRNRQLRGRAKIAIRMDKKKRGRQSHSQSLTTMNRRIRGEICAAREASPLTPNLDAQFFFEPLHLSPLLTRLVRFFSLFFSRLNYFLFFFFHSLFCQF